VGSPVSPLTSEDRRTLLDHDGNHDDDPDENLLRVAGHARKIHDIADDVVHKRPKKHPAVKQYYSVRQPERTRCIVKNTI
jgi:hypothetical protein